LSKAASKEHSRPRSVRSKAARHGALLRREAALARAEQLGGTIIQSAQSVPGVSFGVFADPQGHRIGVAAN
jgi:predicted enzyme related to lactoylglutathione lyase